MQAFPMAVPKRKRTHISYMAPSAPSGSAQVPGSLGALMTHQPRMDATEDSPAQHRRVSALREGQAGAGRRPASAEEGASRRVIATGRCIPYVWRWSALGSTPHRASAAGSAGGVRAAPCCLCAKAWRLDACKEPARCWRFSWACQLL